MPSPVTVRVPRRTTTTAYSWDAAIAQEAAQWVDVPVEAGESIDQAAARGRAILETQRAQTISPPPRGYYDIETDTVYHSQQAYLDERTRQRSLAAQYNYATQAQNALDAAFPVHVDMFTIMTQVECDFYHRVYQGYPFEIGQSHPHTRFIRTHTSMLPGDEEHLNGLWPERNYGGNVQTPMDDYIAPYRPPRARRAPIQCDYEPEILPLP